MLELLIVLACAAAGWFGVSWLISLGRAQTFPDVPADDPAAAWPRILGVDRGAAEDAIRAAYERRLAELVQARPAITTASEGERFEAARRALDLAFREALNRRDRAS